MTLKELQARVDALEKQVELLRDQLAQQSPEKKSPYWWRDQAGRFANDPIFDEIVRLGREYRESQRPGTRRKEARAKKKARP